MAAQKPHAGTMSVIGLLIGPSIPGAYMAITCHTPAWARIWYLAWIVITALFIVAKAGRSDTR